MRILTFMLLLSVTSLRAQSLRPRYKRIILSIMNQQARDWNSGNPEAFMQAYWKNDSLVFITSKGIVFGWDNMLSHYKIAYPDPLSMGHLQFSQLHFVRFNSSTVWVRGKWNLLRDEGNLNGYFTLVWKKKHGKWVIVTDHTG